MEGGGEAADPTTHDDDAFHPWAPCREVGGRAQGLIPAMATLRRSG
jgi:hypothetical protein